jgi:hypothetical protein
MPRIGIVGAGPGGSGYTSTREWMKEAGMSTHRLKDPLMHTVEGRTIDFKDYVLGEGGFMRDEVPALYGPRWNVPSLIWSAVTLNVSEPVPGWQHMWANLASQLDVRLNHSITKVRRENGVYTVVTDRGVLEFDHLVISSPLDEAAGAAHGMELQQGRDNLWITGATTSQESADNIVDFNERLADRMLMAFEGRNPSDAHALSEVASKYRWRTSDK